MSAAEPLRPWTSLQCDDGRHTACRGPEWSCQCSCHHGAAVASTSREAGAEPPPATVHGTRLVDGAAVPRDPNREGDPNPSSGHHTSRDAAVQTPRLRPRPT